MPVFIYKAKAGPGKIKEGSIVAESKEAVISELVRDGYFPISVSEEAKPKPRLISPKTRISQKDVGVFTRQLADLLLGGLTLYQALDTLVKQTGNRSFSHLIMEARDEIKEGNSLSDTLQKYPKVFSPLYINMVRSGESSGALETVLVRLAEFSEKEQELRARVKGALLYPLFLASFGVVTIIVLVTFVVPRLGAVFSDFGQELPLPTRILIGISHFIGSWWWLILVIIISAVFIIKQQQRTKEGRLLFDKWKLQLPLTGRLILTGELARFSRTLSTLLESGIPVLRALEIVTNIVDNSVIRKELSGVYTAISKGASLGSSLEKISYFPILMTNMIKVGEKGGMIEKSLVKIAETYDREIDKATSTFTTLLEPILILTLGLVVGVIVVSMLLPIFNINLAVK